MAVIFSISTETYNFNNSQSRSIYSLVESVFLNKNNKFFRDILGEEFIENNIKKYFLVKIKKIGKSKVKNLEEIDTKISKLILPFVRELMLRLGFTDGLAFDLFESWQKAEKIIFNTKNPYREHFVHQFHDFLVGCLFIAKLSEGYLNKNYCEYQTDILKQQKAQVEEKKKKEERLKKHIENNGKNEIKVNKRFALLDDQIEDINEKISIIEKIGKINEQSDLEIIKLEKKHYPYSKKQLLRRWFLAAMFHDVGYPAETLSDLKRYLNREYYNKIPNYEIKDLKYETFSPDENFPNLLYNIACVHLFSEEIKIGNINDLIKKQSNFMLSINEQMNLLIDEINQSHDHGVTGAIFFLKTALIDVRELVYDPIDTKTLSGLEDEIGDFNNLIDDLTIAASAIAGHNMRVHTYKNYTIDFSARPIAALLEFSDDIQEWNRRKSDNSPKYYNPLSEKINLFKIEDENDKLIITFSIKDNSRIEKGDFKEIEKLFDINLSDYFEFFYNKIEIKTLNFIENKRSTSDEKSALKIKLFDHSNPKYKHKRGRYLTYFKSKKETIWLENVIDPF